jgi:hypothetical protein
MSTPRGPRTKNQFATSHVLFALSLKMYKYAACACFVVRARWTLPSAIIHQTTLIMKADVHPAPSKVGYQLTLYAPRVSPAQKPPRELSYHVRPVSKTLSSPTYVFSPRGSTPDTPTIRPQKKQNNQERCPPRVPLGPSSPLESCEPSHQPSVQRNDTKKICPLRVSRGNRPKNDGRPSHVGRRS